MSLKGAGYIVGAYEHPTRKAADKSVALLHAECAKGALEDAGLTKDDVDGYFCAGDAPGPRPAVDGRLHEPEVPARGFHRCRWFVLSGAVGHALEAIAAGRCSIALITLAGRPRSEGMATGTAPRAGSPAQPEMQFEYPVRPGHREHVRDVRDAAHAPNTAPPASSSPGSRSPPRITRSTTRTRCCATS